MTTHGLAMERRTLFCSGSGFEQETVSVSPNPQDCQRNPPIVHPIPQRNIGR